ncbi:MAG: NADH-quinone oxidoreductase subunit NuoE [Hyphomicrobiales bacterium]|nr:MAG: NADH-quinone oxidoreductase subunit NuoE [Hyphomicrobiales bacterium]
MAVRRLHHEQPASFAFTPENAAWADERIALYPAERKQSAVIPLLMRAQEQEGWVSKPAIETIAGMLDMAEIRVLEVATFYTQFQLAPVGAKAHIQVCGTTPCMLRGSEEIIKVCKRRIAEHAHELSADGSFSWEEVECLGACVNAPMVAVDRDTYEDLTPETFEALLDAFERGETPTPGPQNGRQHSCPEGGPTSLTDPALYGGEAAAAPAPETKAAPAAPAAEVSAETAAEEAEMAAKLAELPSDASAEDKANAVGERPQGLDAPQGGAADDLKRIKGIGKVNEGKLNDLGIFHFAQIAAWTRPEIRWVGTYLAFPGRIDREDWVNQAEALAAGGETAFSKRVDAGDVPTSQE